MKVHAARHSPYLIGLQVAFLIFFFFSRKHIKIELFISVYMQGILLTRHCQVEVISIVKENPQVEEQADS